MSLELENVPQTIVQTKRMLRDQLPNLDQVLAEVEAHVQEESPRFEIAGIGATPSSRSWIMRPLRRVKCPPPPWRISSGAAPS